MQNVQAGCPAVHLINCDVPTHDQINVQPNRRSQQGAQYEGHHLTGVTAVDRSVCSYGSEGSVSRARMAVSVDVDWSSLVGTGLGAVLGVGATLVGEHVRWRRTTRDNRLQDRRNMYADCLVSFRRAHEAMRLAADEEHASPQARAARIRQVFQASGCDEARERLILAATLEVATAIDASYISLRKIREVLASGSTVPSPDYQAARRAHSDTTEAARNVLRRDLGSLDI
ncbi:hypothetical protein ACWDZ8_09885 [Streptomyces sp. NPDC003233]